MVVGAGFAGLTTAYLLAQLGYDVSVYEAEDRVGGRVFTQQWFDRKVEAGAELIGWNFPVWRALAEVFDLHVRELGWDEDETVQPPQGSDTPPPPTAGAEQDEAKHGPVAIGLEPLDETKAERVRDDIETLEQRLAAKSAFVNAFEPWNSTGTYPNDPETLDATSLMSWVTGDAGADTTVEGQILFLAHYSNDNVVEAQNQSMLAVLSQIAGGGGGCFAADTETARCREGNDALACRLQAKLQSWKVPVRLGVHVDGIDQTSTGVTILLASGETVTAEYAVLTAPPPVWNRAQKGVRMPAGFTKADYEVAGGIAVKYFTHLHEPFWKDERPWDALSKEVGVTWQGRVIVRSQDHVLALFAGGQAAQNAATQPDAQEQSAWDTFGSASASTGVHGFYSTHLDRLYRGYAAQRIREKFVWWTDQTDNYVGWAYACPSPGQVARHGRPESNAERLSKPLGRIVFAGEHTCPAFYGYMEGALQSALLAVDRILALHGDARAGVLFDALQEQARVGFIPAPDDGKHSPWMRTPGGSWVWTSKDARLDLSVKVGNKTIPPLTIDRTKKNIRLVGDTLVQDDEAPGDWQELVKLRDASGPRPYVPLGSYLRECPDPVVTLYATCERAAQKDTWSAASYDVTRLQADELLDNVDGTLKPAARG